MGNAIDIVGNRYGKLKVISRAENKGKNTAWNCQCDCGKYVLVRRDLLVKKNENPSFACTWVDDCEEIVRSHGMRKSSTYTIWSGIIQRCNNPNNKRYHDYGGRGITVCDSWLKFENFYKDMGERPEGLSIDRIDNNKGYSPENCKWSTLFEQQANRGTNKNNTSGRKGVTLEKSGKWKSMIMVNKITHRLGIYKTFEEACKARQDAEIKFHGSIFGKQQNQ